MTMNTNIIGIIGFITCRSPIYHLTTQHVLHVCLSIVIGKTMVPISQHDNPYYYCLRHLFWFQFF